MNRHHSHKVIIPVLSFVSCLQLFSQASKKEMQKLIDENMKSATNQYKKMQKIIPDGNC